MSVGDGARGEGAHEAGGGHAGRLTERAGLSGGGGRARGGSCGGRDLEPLPLPLLPLAWPLPLPLPLLFSLHVPFRLSRDERRLHALSLSEELEREPLPFHKSGSIVWTSQSRDRKEQRAQAAEACGKQGAAAAAKSIHSWGGGTEGAGTAGSIVRG